MKLKTFAGGLHPPDDFKHFSNKKPIEVCPLPPELIIPLSMHIGAPAECCVKKGDQVKRGQVIATPKGFVSLPIHASTSGEVVAVEPRLSANGTMVNAVVIKPDGEDAWVDGLEGVDPEKASIEQLRDKIRDAGCCGMGGAAFPTHVKLTPPDDKKIDVLLLNGVECEPFLTADHRLMLEQADRMLDGIRIIMQILGVRRAVIGIEENKMDAIEFLQQQTQGSNISVTPLELKYPQGCEKRLINAETGREVPSGGLPMDVGCVVQNVGTVSAVSDAVRKGLPFIERVMTISGPIVNSPKNLLARIGTPISHLLEVCGGVKEDIAKVIHGGPMMGNALPDISAPAIRGTSGVLFFGKGMVKERAIGPCIRCGRCVGVCPVHLAPTSIYGAIMNEMVDEAQTLHARDCIECGCCGYTCPSAIPLVQAIRQAKAAIWAKKK